jgi:site-specific recombinase XerD
MHKSQNALTATTFPDFLLSQYERALKAEGLSPKTITIYLESLQRLMEFLKSRGMPLSPASLTREHIQEWLIELQETRSPSTANCRYRAAKRYFNWLVEEGEIPDSPMARIKPPKVPEIPIEPMSLEAIKKLLKACEGREFEQRRDMVIIRLYLDTGLRRSELANIRLADVNWEEQYITVIGKGRKVRGVPYGRKTARDLDRYQRVRNQHRDKDMPWLWLGKQGRLTSWGVGQMVKRRAAQAGLEGIHVHLFRHSFSSMWLEDENAREEDLMVLAGWSSHKMLHRYTKAKAAERAREAHKRLSPGDRF